MPITASECITTEDPKWAIVLKQLENRNVFLDVLFSAEFLDLYFSVHIPYFVSFSVSIKGHSIIQLLRS